MAKFKGNKRMEILGYEIIHLISKEYREEEEKIVDEIRNGNVVHYLYEKYKNEFMINLHTNPVYDINEWERVICDNFSYIDSGYAYEKMHIDNGNGLLLILYAILEIIGEDLK